MTISLSDLMKELQAGEEARAKVPQLEASNKEIYRQFDAAQAHNQELELAIRGYKDTIDSLSSRIRSLEVERDDAGFRELEAQDKLNAVLQTLRGIQLDVDEAVAHIDPPKPEPIAQQTVQNASVPMTEEPGVVPVSPGERVADPTAKLEDISSLTASFDTVSSTDTASPVQSSGQSDANPPSAPSTAPTQPSASGDAAEQSQPVPSPKTEEYRPFESMKADHSGPYVTRPNAGRAYWEKPNDMSWSDWQASGGSI